jgi:hypothetical protein
MLLIFRICLYRKALKELKLAFDYLQLKVSNITNARAVLSQQQEYLQILSRKFESKVKTLLMTMSLKHVGLQTFGRRNRMLTHLKAGVNSSEHY